MLEFEDNAQMRANVEAPTGFVVLPIEQYNELLQAANKPPMFTVAEKTWITDGAIEIELDTRAIYKQAMEMLLKTYTPEELAKYDIVPLDKMYFNSPTIAKLTKQEVKSETTVPSESESDPF